VTGSSTAGVDLAVSVGSLELANPAMAASGTYGFGTEFSQLADPASLGAVVVKSLSASPWPGNPAPRLHPVAGGSMLNAVGLENPGVEQWASTGLADLLTAGARVVASIWGRSVEEYHRAAFTLAAVDGPIAWEINLSCPNLEDPRHLFAHDACAAGEVISAVREAAGPSRQLWAKLSPNVSDIVAIASAAWERGASAVTLVNTLSGMAIDVDARRPVLANTYGGVSGPALHAVAVRAIHQVHRELPRVPVVGVGGVSRGTDAVEMLMAGASAVQVGTASFFDPRAPHRVLRELARWCRRRGTTPRELIGAVA
jgi:dihydroorotate dehydrogenase (NAD+) catalytic subunit